MNSPNLRINNCKTYSESPIEMPTLDELFTPPPSKDVFLTWKCLPFTLKKINFHMKKVHP